MIANVKNTGGIFFFIITRHAYDKGLLRHLNHKHYHVQMWNTISKVIFEAIPLIHN